MHKAREQYFINAHSVEEFVRLLSDKLREGWKREGEVSVSFEWEQIPASEFAWSEVPAVKVRTRLILSQSLYKYS